MASAFNLKTRGIKPCFGAMASYLCNISSVSELNLELKLSTKDLLALASMKNVAKREM